jgi:hypothetical protein
MARDLRYSKPVKEIAMQTTYSAGNSKLLIEQRTDKLIKNIVDNTNKSVYMEYGNGVGNGARADRDYAWFRGKHEDANVIVYIPPPQGWG